MVVASFQIGFKVDSLSFEVFLDSISDICVAADGVSEVVGLRGEAVVVVVVGRTVIVDHGPVVLFPVGGKEDNGLWVGVSLLNVLELLVHEGMFLLVDEGHGAASVSDEY
jgi:hypothetical protein